LGLRPQLKRICSKNPRVGDRRQELYFVGTGGDLSTLRAALDACLVRPSEMFEELSDPFPAWPSLDEYMAELEGTPILNSP
jgi:hypothetical protein